MTQLLHRPGDRISTPNRVIKILAVNDEGYQAIHMCLVHRSGKMSYRRFGEPFTLTTAQIQRMFRRASRPAKEGG